jgi:cell division initiation protein
MKITPSAIRQKTFEVGFRGYEKKEVAAFLDEISEVVDVLHKENMELKTRLQNTQSEAKRLKDVEESLFRTLKTAEDTGAAIIIEANDAADLIINEANETATNATSHVDKLLLESKERADNQAATIIGAAEAKAKETIVDLRDNMEGLIRSYEGLVEQREALVKSLRRITQDSLNQIDLSDSHFSRIDGKAQQRAIDELSRSHTYTFGNLNNLDSRIAINPEIEEEQEIYVTEKEEEIHEEERPSAALSLEQEMQTQVVIEEDELVEERYKEEIDDIEEEEVKPTLIERPAPPVQQSVQTPSNQSQNKQSGSFFDDFE